MSVDGWNTLLVLGGTRSGKSEFAESLVAGASSLRYIATAATTADDPEWAARLATHQARRPSSWTTEETGTDPGRLITTIIEAKPDETLLVDDLGGWVTVLLDPAHQPANDPETIKELAAAVRGCAARLVVVSPEVGLSLLPGTTLGRAFTDALGTTNQAVAAASDAVVLVVAGQPTWLKTAGPTATATGADDTAVAVVTESLLTPGALPEVLTPQVQRAAHPTPTRDAQTPPSPDAPAAHSRDAQTAQSPAAGTAEDPEPDLSPERDVGAARHAAADPADALLEPTDTLPIVETGLVIQPGMELPLPDWESGPTAIDRLATLDVDGSGWGNLEQVVRFAAATQGSSVPRPWQAVRVLLLHGDHAGDASAGTSAGDSARRATQARAGEGALAQLAAVAGASLQVVEAPGAAPIEHGPAMPLSEVDAALRYGWRLAEEAVDSGVDLIVLAACGAGTATAAAAVLAATGGAEPAAVLGRVTTPDGGFDDNAWMARCAAVRDAMRRFRNGSREAKDVLAELAGGDIAIATGVLLGAATRRTPVLLDGPMGVAATLASRDLAGQARHWCLLLDDNQDPAVRLAADILGLTPVLNLRLALGEGATALAALPLLHSALSLASSLPPHPSASEAAEPTPASEPAEPTPASEPAEPTPASQPDEPATAADPVGPTAAGEATGPTPASQPAESTSAGESTGPEQASESVPAAPGSTAGPDPEAAEQHSSEGAQQHSSEGAQQHSPETVEHTGPADADDPATTDRPGGGLSAGESAQSTLPPGFGNPRQSGASAAPAAPEFSEPEPDGPGPANPATPRR